MSITANETRGGDVIRDGRLAPESGVQTGSSGRHAGAHEHGASDTEAMMASKRESKQEKVVTTEVRNRWDGPTAAFGWLVLLAFTLLSAYMNAEYATMTGSRVWFHAGVPVVVLVLGVFVELTFLSSTHGWARKVVIVGLGAAFVVVMIASYLAVREVTVAWNPAAPAWVNNSLAAIPDLVMIMAATVILSLRKRSHDRVQVDAKRTAPGRFKRLADAATARAESALAVPPSPQVTAVTDVRGRSTEPHGASVEATDEVSTDGPADARGASTRTVTDAPVEPPPPSVKPATEPRRTPPKPSFDPALEPFMDAAERMVADGIVARKTPQEIAAVIRAIDEGATDNAIKKAGIASAGTAQKVRAELDYQRAAAPLAAVG